MSSSMVMPSLSEVFEFAEEKFEIASGASKTIHFSEDAVRNKYARIQAKSLSNIPKFDGFVAGFGVSAKTAVLFVDLRKSTDRAVEHGPKNTYLMTHTLLPTLAHLVNCAGGRVGNFRGDGLFALFGLNDEGVNSPAFSYGEEAWRAVKCGKSMLEGVYEAVNPILENNDVPAGLNIGVGIDTGEVVITRVGLPGVNEVTAYGNAVNWAAKNCGGNGVIKISDRGWNHIPTAKGGRVRAKKLDDGTEGYKVFYPDDIKLLSRPAKAKAR